MTLFTSWSSLMACATFSAYWAGRPLRIKILHSYRHSRYGSDGLDGFEDLEVSRALSALAGLEGSEGGSGESDHGSSSNGSRFHGSSSGPESGTTVVPVWGLRVVPFSGLPEPEVVPVW